MLPKIEGQIAELNKADEPTDTTRAIKDQLEVGFQTSTTGHAPFSAHANHLVSVSVDIGEKL